METTLNRQELKGLLKEALTEILEERRDLFRDAFEEALEDISLSRAIERCDRGKLVRRAEIFKVFEDAA